MAVYLNRFEVRTLIIIYITQIVRMYNLSTLFTKYWFS